MKKVPRESWWYGLGLVLLFTMAAAATFTVIDTVERLIDQAKLAEAKQVSMIGTWLLTMGLMCLAAGLGMWAIQYASVRASLRRLGSFIDAMDYFHDGLVAINRKRQVVNANPAARRLAPILQSAKTPLQKAFACLSEDDMTLLTDTSGPNEIERELIGVTTLQTLRFRSQPTPDIQLLLISDVTFRKAQEANQREAARLQLVGRIARGVANDFNRILSIVSSQTGLLTRLSGDRNGADQAANEIYRAIQNGSNLATHLLDLSDSDTPNTPTDFVEQHLRRAVELLRLALPSGWTVSSDIGRNLPSVNLSGTQVEQAVMNLGLICCDALRRPATVKISAHVPGSGHLDSVGGQFALVILVSATHTEEGTLLEAPPANDEFHGIHEEAGAVLTVVRSVIEESGGRLDRFQTQDTLQVFRVALPMVRQTGVSLPVRALPAELQPALSGKALLLAVAPERGDKLEAQAQTIGLRVIRAADVLALLAAIEKGSYDALLLDRDLIEPEATAMLRAIAKLRPKLAILVLGSPPRTPSGDIPANTRFFPVQTTPTSLFQAIAEAVGAKRG